MVHCTSPVTIYHNIITAVKLHLLITGTCVTYNVTFPIGNRCMTVHH